MKERKMNLVMAGWAERIRQKSKGGKASLGFLGVRRSAIKKKKKKGMQLISEVSMHYGHVPPACLTNGRRGPGWQERRRERGNDVGPREKNKTAKGECCFKTAIVRRSCS